MCQRDRWLDCSSAPKVLLCSTASRHTPTISARLARVDVSGRRSAWASLRGRFPTAERSSISRTITTRSRDAGTGVYKPVLGQAHLRMLA
jgi:hypothetical protein